MPELLVLVNFEGEVPSSWEPHLGTEREGDGFIGDSLWVGVGDSETSLGLIHYSDEVAGAAHLRQRVEATDGLPGVSAVPPTVRHLRLENRHGQRLEATAVGSYLTTVHFLARAGYGDEEGEKVDETLESIEPIDGYAGHVRGVNSALEDEVWALVLWSCPPIIPHSFEEDAASFANYRRVR